MNVLQMISYKSFFFSFSKFNEYKAEEEVEINTNLPKTSKINTEYETHTEVDVAMNSTSMWIQFSMFIVQSSSSSSFKAKATKKKTI